MCPRQTSTDQDHKFNRPWMFLKCAEPHCSNHVFTPVPATATDSQPQLTCPSTVGRRCGSDRSQTRKRAAVCVVAIRPSRLNQNKPDRRRVASAERGGGISLQIIAANSLYVILHTKNSGSKWNYHHYYYWEYLKFTIFQGNGWTKPGQSEET